MATTKKSTTTTTSTAKPRAPKAKKISEEDIRMRAEKIYQERLEKGKHGDHLSDWLEAEKEIVEVK